MDAINIVQAVYRPSIHSAVFVLSVYLHLQLDLCQLCGAADGTVEEATAASRHKNLKERRFGLARSQLPVDNGPVNAKEKRIDEGNADLIKSNVMDGGIGM